jgi:hypothetical protein
VTYRVLMSTINEAAAVVQLGTADAGTVDEIFQKNPRGREGRLTCPIPLVRRPVASRTVLEVPGQGITTVQK